MNRKNILPFTLVTSLFFLWALTSNLIPTLIPHLKKACRLSDLQSAYIDSAYWMAYFVVRYSCRPGYATVRLQKGYHYRLVYRCYRHLSCFILQPVSERSASSYSPYL
jgi:hypothetical protein